MIFAALATGFLHAVNAVAADPVQTNSLPDLTAALDGVEAKLDEEKQVQEAAREIEPAASSEDHRVVEARTLRAIAEHEFEKKKMDLYIKAYTWQAFTSGGVFFLVIALVGTSIMFAGFEFARTGVVKNFTQAADAGNRGGSDMEKDAAIGTGESDAKGDEKDAGAGTGGTRAASVTGLTINKDGLTVTSSVLGVIILVIAFGFFYLYLVFVYPIKREENGPSTVPAVGSLESGSPKPEAEDTNNNSAGRT